MLFYKTDEATSASVRCRGSQSSRLGQSELVPVEGYEAPDLKVQRCYHMPQVKRTAWSCPSQPFGHRCGLPQ